MIVAPLQRIAVAVVLTASLAACASQGFVPKSTSTGELRLAPILRWNPFPTPDYDSLRDRIRNVSYEIRIWKAYSPARYELAREALAYSRSGLELPTHQVKEPLEPDKVYVWAVRARFTLDGEWRATPWSTASGWDRESVIPERGYAAISTGSTSPTGERG
jgi:hypothetical protein